MDPLAPGDPDRVASYRLTGRLGRGGMGEVFMGRSAGGRPVAVKLLHAAHGDDPAFRRAFATEVEAARRVGGFFTAQVVEADAYAERPWLVTAYVPGPSLQAAVTAHGGLPMSAVWVLGAGLAEGLAAVHACGLVHRDLKPSNVIVAADGPRVIDFGIARALEVTSQTATGTIIGTPAYMSPEQARGDREVGYASDVFSLGSVLAFAATGRCPAGDGHPSALLYRIIHEQPDLSRLPAELHALVAACLAKEPARRPDVAAILRWCSANVTTGEWLPQAVDDMVRGDQAAVGDTRGASPGTRIDAPDDGAGDRAARPSGGATLGDPSPRQGWVGRFLSRWRDEAVRSATPGHIREGWNGVSWGATIADFRRRFPGAVLSGDWWLTGDGPEEFCGIRMHAQYGFNDRERLYTVVFLPEPQDRERIAVAMLNELGTPPGTALHWTTGEVEISNKIGGIAVMVTHSRFEPTYEEFDATTSGATREAVESGWNGLAWGATVAEFRRRFPAARQNGTWWQTGDGPEAFCDIVMDVQYAFSAQDEFYMVAFYPEPEDRERLSVAAVNEWGAPDGSGTTWTIGQVEVSVKAGGVAAAVTHGAYSDH